MAGTNWVVFQNDTGARTENVDADEVNGNFDWIEGTFEPMLAGTKTDATYDLGTATYSWRNIYMTGNLYFEVAKTAYKTVPWSACMMEDEDLMTKSGTYIGNTASPGVVLNVYVPIILAVGCQLNTIDVYCYDANVLGAIEMRLYSLATDGTRTQIGSEFGTTNAETAGNYTKTLSSIATTISGTTSYWIELNFDNIANANELRFYFARLTYNMVDLEEGI